MVNYAIYTAACCTLGVLCGLQHWVVLAARQRWNPRQENAEPEISGKCLGMKIAGRIIGASDRPGIALNLRNGNG